MPAVTLDFLAEQLELGEQLLQTQGTMLTPQELPGRYGLVVKTVDHLLQVLECEAVVAGGWAVWHHGYFARVTQDIDIALAKNRIDAFLHAAAVSGFEVLAQPAGRWPKLRHKDTDVQVDILPEGEQPGTQVKPAPTTIPNPTAMGASGFSLRYISLPALVELKLAAGRGRDESEVIELMRANLASAEAIHAHLAGVHRQYVDEFDRLLARAREREDK
jgi:predicted nucleotidyltransferase